jgi:indole-3-glycerol phosphate synthase
MPDYLDVLARNAQLRLTTSYYERPVETWSGRRRSLKQSILQFAKAAVIAEIKPQSPSSGMLLSPKERDVGELAQDFASGGAVGISVLTEPAHFKGSLENLSLVRKRVNLPILMKDIILDPVQIEAAAMTGADCVLLIQALHDRGHSAHEVETLIERAHSEDLEVLLETHTAKEFSSALDSSADLVGINNRDLATLKVDLRTTAMLLESCSAKSEVILSESGIETPEDIKFLSKFGVRAFLVGTCLMKARDPRLKLEELVNSL